jgi:hypothetical protein
LARKRRVGSQESNDFERTLPDIPIPGIPSRQSLSKPEAVAAGMVRQLKAEWIRLRKYTGEARLPLSTWRSGQRLRPRVTIDFATNFPVAKFPPPVSNQTN